MAERKANIRRETQETAVALELAIDGTGEFEMTTGLRMFDHLLSQLAKHGVFNIKVAATGTDPHHLVEDVALCLGRVLNQALGEKQGIVRMAHAMVPMDDALALAAVDIGGRGYAVVEAPFDEANITDLPTNLIRHFLESFACEARINLHVRILAGTDDHHKAEAIFKALGRALDTATRFDDRIRGQVPSTKMVID